MFKNPEFPLKCLFLIVDWIANNVDFVFLGIFYFSIVDVEKRLAQQLRKIILLQFGLVTCKVRFRKNSNILFYVGIFETLKLLNTWRLYYIIEQFMN